MTARTKSLVVHPHVCRLLINQGSFASLNTINAKLQIMLQ